MANSKDQGFPSSRLNGNEPKLAQRNTKHYPINTKYCNISLYRYLNAIGKLSVCGLKTYLEEKTYITIVRNKIIHYIFSKRNIRF